MFSRIMNLAIHNEISLKFQLKKFNDTYFFNNVPLINFHLKLGIGENSFLLNSI